MKNENIFSEYNIEGINEIIDESKGNSFIALREVRWNPNSDYKLDLRRWYINKDGEEVPGKGISFTNDSGPESLCKVLMNNGFAKPDDVIFHIIDNSDDYPKRIVDECNKYAYSKMEEKDNSYYDPKEILGGNSIDK